MLNKIFISVLLLLTFSEAKDTFSSERLLGIEVGYGSAKYERNSISKSNDDPEYGFRIGAQNRDWRTTFIGNLSRGKEHKYQKAMLTFDHFVWQSLYEKDHIMFKPYIGGHIGWIKHTADGLSENGMLYGGEVGIVWNVIDEVDFDLGYRYSATNLDTLDSLDAMTIGLNYIY
jgi:opacity protein-like surface antigen